MVQVSDNLEDYEVLSILGADLNSTCYKVKQKTTSEIFVWKAISYDDFVEEEMQSLLLQIEKQKVLDQPHLLKIHESILHEPTKILYLVCEFCIHGNLNSMIQKCLLENKYFHEEFIWRTLYQLAYALKIKGDLIYNLSVNNVFIDEGYKAKLFNNDLLKGTGRTLQTRCFSSIILELCMPQSNYFAEKCSNSAIKLDIPHDYSNELKELIKFIAISNLDTKATVDMILSYPRILLKATQNKINTVYVKNHILKVDSHVTTENCGEQKAASRQLRLESIKNREIALQIREEKFAEKARELHKREKKVALMERTVHEKMLHAEVYLKRCREVRSTSSGSSSNKQISSYETIDTSFAASSVIAPTSSRINLHAVKKPSVFSRTMSDRRVRFKGHSPLKDLSTRFNAKEMKGAPLQIFNSRKSTADDNFIKPDYEVEEISQKKIKSRKKLDVLSMLPAKSRKPLVEISSQYIIPKEMEKGNVQHQQRPVSWTKENKQQAFDMLRFMNQEEDAEIIRHTYL